MKIKIIKMIVCRQLRRVNRFPIRNMKTDAVKVNEKLMYKNPVDELHQYLEIPLFKENEVLFTPTVEEMKKAQKLFRSTSTHEIKYLTSAIDQFPKHNLPEVTFIGQSNVGKSSLLKAIFCAAPDLRVKTSKTPGHTKLIDFFQVGSVMCLVDVPGYGYRQPEYFTSSVEVYLKTRPNLKRTFLLIDGKEGFQKWDKIAIEMLDEFQIPYCLIITKIDTASTGEKLKNLMSLQEIRKKLMSNLCFPQPFLVSAVTGEGIAYLQAFVSYVTGNFKFMDKGDTSKVKKR